VSVAHLSRVEQRRRIIEFLHRKEGVYCPELVVEDIEEPMGSAVNVIYRCKEGDPVKTLCLNDREARHIGLKRPPPGEDKGMDR
jgi:hypothetical protein